MLLPPCPQVYTGSHSLRLDLPPPEALFLFVRRHLRLAYYLLLYIAGHLIVVTELHRVRALPLRDAAQLGGVGRDLGERHLGLDHGQVAGEAVLVLDAGALRIEVTEDRARVLGGTRECQNDNG